MTIEMTVGVQLEYGLAGTSDILLQIEAAADVPGQRVLQEKIEMPAGEHTGRIPGEDGLGTRVWLRSGGPLTVSYHARVAVDRPCPDFAGMAAVPPHQLGAEPTRYLLPSRFCPSDRFQSFVAHEFPGLGGGALVQASLDTAGALGIAGVVGVILSGFLTTVTAGKAWALTFLKPADGAVVEADGRVGSGAIMLLAALVVLLGLLPQMVIDPAREGVAGLLDPSTYVSRVLEAH